MRYLQMRSHGDASNALRCWVRQDEIDDQHRAATDDKDARRSVMLEQDNRELRRCDFISRTGSDCLAALLGGHTRW